MYGPPIEQGPIRPVPEAESLLIRTTRSCPWNRCHFCVHYKGMPFSIRSVAEIKEDIQKAADYFDPHGFESCFLQDGDSFIMKTADLLEVLSFLKETFPGLSRITSYGRASTMVRKSPSEMKEIFDAGINRLYCGMESGSDRVLSMMNKGISSADLIEAGKLAKEAGMEISEFIILGLGGEALSREHAIETARVLSAINPDFIRIRTIGVKAGSLLETMQEKGEWSAPGEVAMVEEQKLLVAHLDGITSTYTNDHSINLLPEISGSFPHDKARLLSFLDGFLALPDEEKSAFVLGRRMGACNRLSQMEDTRIRRRVERKALELGHLAPHELENLFHQARQMVM